MSISYSIAIDYEDNGSFTSFGDVISAEVLELRWRLGMSAPYQRLSEPASAEILLRNSFQQFSPDYMGIYVGTTVRTHFLGSITALEPEAGLYGKQQARLLAQGREAELKEQKVRLPMMLEFTADEAIERILQQVKWRYDSFEGMCIIDRDY